MAISYIKKLFISLTSEYGVTVKQRHIRFERRKWSSQPLEAKTQANKPISNKNLTPSKNKIWWQKFGQFLPLIFIPKTLLINTPLIDPQFNYDI
jgi:hypothetical protein